MLEAGAVNLPTSEQGETVVVAMSGGVDSCAAALMLAEAGYSIVGISMQVWDYRKNNGNAKKATCCAPADFQDARGVAAKKGFRFYVFDFEESFHEAVIAPFVASYLNGLTPNPCLECNRKVKFRELRKRALALGAKKVATGHYAQVKRLDEDNWGLFTALDTAKDQSYFLYAMTQSDLATTLFPVGGMKKPEVRAYLAEHELEVSSKEESQDICFVSGEVSEFIETQTGARGVGGSIRSVGGEKLGEHEGIHQFTVGQRRGLGVSNKSPLYVINIDAGTNDVVVGEKEELRRESFVVGEVNWVSGVVPEGRLSARVKMRYRHAGVSCDVYPLPEGRARVVFKEEWSAVSPGQAAVFYSETPAEDGSFQVYGGGIISKE